ncbi:hypothetical protein T4A_3253 [Trichinella pseudospiralis]|uniref:Uncharacterized protein n=1 Tax=Trichinella pseudospiralis TaxID=6337 RepID=A0A0V1DQW0_TRIPS|nr:hypothetical protein T4A_3253 [Trichinella pseudospiralis]
MICRLFLKSPSLTSLFLLKLFKDENLSGDFCNHPHLPHFSHKKSSKM